MIVKEVPSLCALNIFVSVSDVKYILDFLKQEKAKCQQNVTGLHFILNYFFVLSSLLTRNKLKD